MSSNADFLSPFEELVITALANVGNGSSNAEISREVMDLSGRQDISFKRIIATLEQLENDFCVHSWINDARFDHPEPEWLRRYRIQFRGERALNAALQRHGRPSQQDFYRASRFGILWDSWRSARCRRRAESLSWHDGKPIIF